MITILCEKMAFFIKKQKNLATKAVDGHVHTGGRSLF
jgi:hypothetical protein